MNNIFLNNKFELKSFFNTSKKSILVVSLFLLQLFTAFGGVHILGKYINPFFLLIPALILTYVYFMSVIDSNSSLNYPPASSSYRHFLFLLLVSILGVINLTFYLRVKNYNLGDSSDVFPQIIALYDRWLAGEQPYYPLPLVGYAPFPVYMPFHWLPVGIARFLHLSPPVFGLLFLSVVVLYFSWSVFSNNRNMVSTIFLLLTVVVICLFAQGIHIAYTFEALIGGYYLILAFGLLFRNFWIVMLGIICALLSRYTIVFWLPLYAILFFINQGLLKSMKMWSIVILSVVLIYVIPFYLPAPDTLVKGVTYHNKAAIDEWSGFGTDAISYTFESGIYFAPHLKAMFSGDMSHRVFCARIVQASLMLLLLFGGLIAYHKWRDRINFYDFSLGILFLVMLFFYEFGPLCYTYYLISLFLVELVLCIKIAISENNLQNQASRFVMRQ